MTTAALVVPTPTSTSTRVPPTDTPAADATSSANCPTRRSLDGSFRTAITFVNSTGRAVKVYWVDYRGFEQFYFEMQPGQSVEQKTYVSNVWCVRDKASNVALFSVVATHDHLLATIAVPSSTLSVLATASSRPASAPWLTDPMPSAYEDGPYLVLRKELYGFENYGTADGRADVLYSGNTGTWNFSVTEINAGTPVRFVVKGALDDHYDIASDSYSIKVTVNEDEAFGGFPTGFQHGAPFGTKFTNWSTLYIEAAGETSITIQNTSPIWSAHWIAIDWIELLISREDLLIEHADCTLGWTRLAAGGQARVSEDNVNPNRVRSAPSLAASRIALLYPGTVLKVLEGPICADGVVFWRVVSGLIPGSVGWTAEGDGTEYYLGPYEP